MKPVVGGLERPAELSISSTECFLLNENELALTRGGLEVSREGEQV